MHLASVRIITDDVPRAAAFYERLLGMSAERPVPQFAVFRAATGTLAIGAAETVPEPGFADAHGGVIVEFQADSPAAVDEAYQGLATRTDSLVQPPTDMPWGNRSLLVRDPDGNLVNVFASLPR
ncbi:VOC family protein [Amnibacterium endophyticum]|uniref:VOC family protein n=1 Tax=Amnibacterium endophyticum TaxID=2109337 RepID=A0ABW4LJI7_9MICO